MNFSRHFPKTRELLDSARREGVFGSFAVGFHYKGLAAEAYGNCGEESLFDLASLTKVLCTTTLMALAEQKNELAARESVKTYFSQFEDQRVTLSHLLNHSSGLPAWLPLHAHFHDQGGLGRFDPRMTPCEARRFYEEEILKNHKSSDFERACVYSDLGFMLLGWTLEKKFKMPLDALFQEWIVLPGEFDSLQFLPTTPDVVPTEDCPWRGRVLRGEVHDDNAYVLGGVAGHAGLFGNVQDVTRFGAMWLEAVTGRTSRQNSAQLTLDAELARRYFSFTHVAGSMRSLGWDGVSKENSTAGRLFSELTRGHLGFTGTSLWIDPKNELAVALLTNRVHPTRSNEKIKAFRPAFHDSLLSELGIG